MTILVGTASWPDKSLVDSGKFYPPDATSPEARLRCYASQFPLVEVDSSYYAMPLAVTTQRMRSGLWETSSAARAGRRSAAASGTPHARTASRAALLARTCDPRAPVRAKHVALEQTLVNGGFWPI